MKNNIINEFKLNALKKADGREKQKIMGMMLSVVIIAGLLIFYVTSLSLSLVDILKQINQLEMLLIFGWSKLFIFFNMYDYTCSGLLFKF